MIITDSGNSEDINYKKFCNYMHSYSRGVTIDINFNGLKYRGRITSITYKEVDRSNISVVSVSVETITELIEDLIIGEKK